MHRPDGGSRDPACGCLHQSYPVHSLPALHRDTSNVPVLPPGVFCAHFVFSHRSAFWFVSQGSGYRRHGEKGEVEVQGAE